MPPSVSKDSICGCFLTLNSAPRDQAKHLIAAMLIAMLYRLADDHGF